MIGGRLLSHRDGLVIRFGEFLRDTRLDELPQLFNILRGDMAFLGPRPLRPEVYENLCKTIAGYDICFTRKPGLVGCSQIFTPHSSPKRLRSYVDHLFLKETGVPARKVLFIAITMAAVAVRVTTRSLRNIRESIHLKLLVRQPQRRSLTRQHPPGVMARIHPDTYQPGIESRLLDLNEEVLKVRCRERIEAEDLQMDIRVAFYRWTGPLKLRRRRRNRRVRCRGRVLQMRPAPDGWDIVISYRPVTSLGVYVVHQYLLRKSLVHPFCYSRRGIRCKTS